MPNYSKVIQIGHLARDPELHKFDDGNQVAGCAMAVNNPFAKDDENGKKPVCFTDIKIWGKQAGTFCDYLKKGDAVMVEGRLDSEKWQDKDTGANRSKHIIVVDRFVFLPKGEGQAAAGGAVPPSAPSTPPTGGQGGGGEDDAIPF